MSRSTVQMQVQPEILFAHAYMVSLDPRRLGAMHPLSPLPPAEVAAFVADRAKAAVVVWDSTFRRDIAAFDVAVSRNHPRLAWLYTHPTTRDVATQFCSIARRSGAVVVAAGPDARLRPARYLRAGADAIVLGDGERSTLDLVQALRTNEWRPEPEVLARIPGIAWMDRYGTLRYSAGTERSVPIEELPRPHRDPHATRIHLERWLKLRRYRGLGLRSARGCPVPCGFCSNSVFGRPYRRRRPADVVAEMTELVASFPVDRLVFTDEVFVFDRLWLQEFAELLRAADLGVGFEASAHPATIDKAAVEALAAAGCVRLELDAASGSQRLLDALGWSYSAAEVYRAVGLIRDAGLDLGLRVLVGLAGETRADLDKTFEMVSIATPTGVEVTRVDPGSPALFRKDWERVVAGPLIDRARVDGVLPSIVLDAAVAWLDGRGTDGGDALPQRLVQVAQQPVLRAAVRALPGFWRR